MIKDPCDRYGEITKLRKESPKHNGNETKGKRAQHNKIKELTRQNIKKYRYYPIIRRKK
jgi:hypothetical protein